MAIFSVSDVNQYIKLLFERDGVLTSLFVRGEISNFKKHHSGHCYFTLKDSGSMIKAVMFRSRAQFVKFSPKDGLRVIAGGNISIFERDGQYQLYVDQLIPDGVGELNLAYEQLKEKLSMEGLFDETRKKQLPFFPKTVGIITSPTGAAIRDIITVAKRRNPGVALTLYPVQVQGVDAPEQIVQAILTLNRLASVDVIITGRGGGSLEELWAFNDERVVRAIGSSAIPVISAVGHETDFTLSDFAADVRAATPSQAAELAVPDVRELQRYIETIQSVLKTSIRRAIDTRRQFIIQLRESRNFNRPHDLLSAKQQITDMFIIRMHEAEKKLFTRKQHSFQIAAEKLAMLSPLSVLSRGYSITRDEQGTVIRSAAMSAPGQRLEIIVNKGKIRVNVTGIEEENDAKQTV